MENKIDLGSYTIPTSWDEVTLKMFQEIEEYYSDKEKNFDAREVLHIFTDKSIDEINSLPIEITELLLSKMRFLSEEKPSAEPSNKVEVDGETYVINVMEKLKTGEYIALDTAMKSNPHDYASFLAILCRKDSEVYDSRYEAEVFGDRKKMWERQPMVKILPLIGFFLDLYMTLETPSHLSSLVEEELNRIQRHIETSQNLGVFRKRYLKYRVKKLRKSLRSSKNTSQTHSSSSHT